MLQFNIPNSYYPERSYILNVIFKEFLGIEIEIFPINDLTNYEIESEEFSKKIVFSDDFFSKTDDCFLKKKYFPNSVFNFQSPFSNEMVKGIYGHNKIYENEKELYLGIDIFASAFFMLTRWEEFVNSSRDKHNRFPATSSVAFRNNFLHRPVVNEYVEFLWNLLKYLGYKGERKRRDFQVIPTHDIDFFSFPHNTPKHFAHDLFIKRNTSIFSKRLKSFIHDPFHTFDYLMDISEQYNAKSRFYFMAGKKHPNDPPTYYDTRKFRKLVDQINQREHVIGYHGSYNTYNDLDLLMKEKFRLEEYIKAPIVEGRQHFLRFSVPQTWNIWDKAGMRLDGTLSYADHEGFRAGVCYDYPVFDIIQRKQLNVWERPLILMEGSLINYRKVSPEIFLEKIEYYSNMVRKYKGNFVFLWHNSSFNFGIWEDYQDLYEHFFN